MAISPPHPTGPPPPNVDRATPGLLIATWIFFAIAFLVVFVRVYTRFLVKNGAKGWDDFCMIVALLLGLAWAIITSYQVHLGYGRHAAYLPMENASKLGALNIVVTDINALVLFFIRTSICIFLLRMTQGLNNSLQWSISIWIAFTLNALVLIGTIVLYSILCIPLNSLWDLSVQGNCSVLEHATTTIKALGAINCLVDFLCVIIPIVIISRLQLKSRTQLGLILILLSCGVVTASCSIGRVVSLKDQVESDPTYDWVDQTYWQIAEQYGGIIFASLPAIRQLSAHWKQTHSFKAYKRSGLSLSDKSTNRGHHEARDDFGTPRTPRTPRTPGPFSPAYKKPMGEYIELSEDTGHGWETSHLKNQNQSPDHGGLPPAVGSRWR